MQSPSNYIETEVLIIGGGVTGTGVARDLALRGVPSVLIDKADLNAGASGANHGLLHSGARYVASDAEAAKECRLEGELLKRLAPHCIDNCGGLFVAVAGDDENYVADFPQKCNECGIPAESISIDKAAVLEPALSEQLIAAFRVPDASVDPFRLSLDNIAQAQQSGALFLKGTKAESFTCRKNRIEQVVVRHMKTGETTTVRPRQVINAGGAWADKITALADIHLDMIYSKGTLVVTQRRLTRHVINRLRLATDGDILVPGGTVSIVGTTSLRVTSPDGIRPTVKEVDAIIDDAAGMIPALASTRYIRAYAGVRPLFGNGHGSGDRSVSRGFALLDHAENGVENFITITGGKLTTYRLMAEKTVDLACRKLGVTAPCRTHIDPLPNTENGCWTEPGRSPRQWMKQQDSKDPLLCECDMVPQSVITAIARQIDPSGRRTDLNAIALRSRFGKGPCQGTYCSARVVSYLYDTGLLNGDQGVAQIRSFLRGRWRGQHPLLWENALMQSELMEAIHCGFFSFEQDTCERQDEDSL